MKRLLILEVSGDELQVCCAAAAPGSVDSAQLQTHRQTWTCRDKRVGKQEAQKVGGIGS